MSRIRSASKAGWVFGLVFLWSMVATPRFAAAQAEAVEYYATDALGSVRVVFDAAGIVRARSDYLPFGEAWVMEGALPAQRFTGQERDAEAGFDHFNLRSFSVRTGRFMRVDPVGGSPATPQSWNRYTYVLNSPLAFVDPTGGQADSLFGDRRCSAEFSFGACGGSDRFWDTGPGGGGLEFGDGYGWATRGGYFEGMPDSMWAGLQSWSERSEHSLNAGLANDAAERGDWDTLARLWMADETLEILVVKDLRGVTQEWSYQDAVVEYMKANKVYGLIDESSLQCSSRGCSFEWKDPRGAVASLASNPMFASGPLGLMHASDVGSPVKDFRTWSTYSAPHSLQVNIGPRGGWADLDRYNPYDVGGFVAHAMFEVNPLWKRPWGKW